MTARGAIAVILLTALIAAASPAVAHHVGTYTARDNEISANFKQIKFSIQARKLDVALRLFDEGALRKAMQARAANLPPGLEASTRGALRGADAATAEAALALFFSALAKDLATEAEAKVADAKTPLETRVTAATKFLEAIWRYWSLVDFVVSQRDVKSAAAMRLAFEDAEGNTKGASAPVAVNPCSGRRPPPAREAGTPDPDRLRASFARIARVLGDVVQHLTPLATKPPA